MSLGRYYSSDNISVAYIIVSGVEPLRFINNVLLNGRSGYEGIMYRLHLDKHIVLTPGDNWRSMTFTHA